MRVAQATTVAPGIADWRLDQADTEALSPNTSCRPSSEIVRRARGEASVTQTVGAENLRHNAPGAVTPLNPEMVQVGDAAGQRA